MRKHHVWASVIMWACLMTYSTCICATPRRQARSLGKLLMHIRYDPVRLIRYSFAWDITKEIMKSWRDIIPTVLLLPITSRLPDTAGVTKFIKSDAQVIKTTRPYSYHDYGDTYPKDPYHIHYLDYYTSLDKKKKQPISGQFTYSSASDLNSDSLDFKDIRDFGYPKQPLSSIPEANYVSASPYFNTNQFSNTQYAVHTAFKPAGSVIFNSNHYDSQYQVLKQQNFMNHGLQLVPKIYPKKKHNELLMNDRRHVKFKALLSHQKPKFTITDSQIEHSSPSVHHVVQPHKIQNTLKVYKKPSNIQPKFAQVLKCVVNSDGHLPLKCRNQADAIEKTAAYAHIQSKQLQRLAHKQNPLTVQANDHIEFTQCHSSSCQNTQKVQNGLSSLKLPWPRDYVTSHAQPDESGDSTKNSSANDISDVDYAPETASDLSESNNKTGAMIEVIKRLRPDIDITNAYQSGIWLKHKTTEESTENV